MSETSEYKTMAELIQETIKLISQVAGQAVQTYSEDTIASWIQYSFDMIFDRAWWDDFMDWIDSDLDGAQGVPIDDISGIKRFIDVKEIYPKHVSGGTISATPAGYDQPLRAAPKTNFNPSGVLGTRALFYQAYNKQDGKCFRILPVTCTDSITIHARFKPARFVATDEIKMDPLLLIAGAAWQMIESDGTNPGSAQRFQAIHEQRFSDLMENKSESIITLDGANSDYVPMVWTDRGA